MTYGIALTAGPALAGGPSGNVYLAAVTVDPSGIFLDVASAANPDGGGQSLKVRLIVGPDATDRVLATALSAAAAHRPVNLWLNGCVATNWGYAIPEVYSITYMAT